ncbi:MAG TPA: YwaF family protein, partial [Burkholderiaceae bacterium]|nr:YwaF family protein [Burkholderiaceae bacterium]
MVQTAETFSSFWWQTSGTTVAFTVAMLFALRFLRQEQRALYARALGWTLVLWVVFPPTVHALTGHWQLSYSLPLQWCDFTGGIAGLALLTRRQFFYEVSLFWGVAGAGSALLTPQFTQGTEWFYLMEFFVSHCILLSAPFFLSIYGNMRPRTWSWLGSLGWLNAVSLVVGAFDLLS